MTLPPLLSQLWPLSRAVYPNKLGLEKVSIKQSRKEGIYLTLQPDNFLVVTIFG